MADRQVLKGKNYFNRREDYNLPSDLDLVNDSYNNLNYSVEYDVDSPYILKDTDSDRLSLTYIDSEGDGSIDEEIIDAKKELNEEKKEIQLAKLKLEKVQLLKELSKLKKNLEPSVMEKLRERFGEDSIFASLLVEKDYEQEMREKQEEYERLKAELKIEALELKIERLREKRYGEGTGLFDIF